MDILVGSHVDADSPIEGAAQRGAQIAQIMLGDPQSWGKPTVSFEGGPAALKEAAEAAGLQLVVHAAYLINVASPNNRVRIPSRKLLQQTVQFAAEIGAIGVVVHGGHVTEGTEQKVGYQNWFKCVDQLDLAVPIFIENTAGGKHAMARYLDSIEQLWSAISTANSFANVGFCLDTCHAHAAGEQLHGLTERVRSITGRIDLVHANDSRDAFGSGADRHANLGQGQADPEGIVEVVRTALRADGSPAPAVVETPGGPEAQAADIAWLRARLG
jgi:deoxyribonuclease-4